VPIADVHPKIVETVSRMNARSALHEFAAVIKYTRGIVGSGYSGYSFLTQGACLLPP
jgi:hypothetical protein